MNRDSQGPETQGAFSFETRKVLSVGQLTRAVKGQLESQFEGVWVRGEISDMRIPSSGHYYFNLKDDDASLKVVVFKSTAARLKFKLKDGHEILARGRITVYEPKGEYQLVSDAIEPVGAGALQLAFEDLKKKLAAEGLFEAARKKPLPYMPRRIGIVTSRTGAALRDVLVVLRRRAPGVHVLVVPVKVQGEGAAPEIAEGIRRMDRKGGVDVIIITRGGGSLEDLWAFNEEPVARAIAACVTPTISAIGHEIDYTIADFVADKRAATPSNAAEIAVPDERELKARIRDVLRRLANAQRRRIARDRQGVEERRRRLKDPRRVLEDQRLQVDDLVERIGIAYRRGIAARRAAVVGMRRTLFSAGPLARAARERQRFEKVRAALVVSQDRRLALRRARLGELVARLDSISPLAVLRRGYALVRDEATGAVVRREADVRVGQALTVTLAEGQVPVTVRGKTKTTTTSTTTEQKTKGGT